MKPIHEISQLLPLRGISFPIVIKVEVVSPAKIGQERGKPDRAPFPEIERPKQNFLHQFERFAERFKNLDFHYS